MSSNTEKTVDGQQSPPALPSKDVSVTFFREWSKVGDNEPESLLEFYRDIAQKQIERICGIDSFADLPDDNSLAMATMLLMLDMINQKSFPSKAITESVNKRVLSLVSSHIDMAKQTVFTRDKDLEDVG